MDHPEKVLDKKYRQISTQLKQIMAKPVATRSMSLVGNL